MAIPVGQRAERTRAVSKRDIELFTEISGDRNPIHYDEEAAKQSRFGEIVVQGGITSAILNALVAEDLPGPGTVFLHVDWSFKAPVRPGDEITGKVEVLEARSDPPFGESTTHNWRSEIAKPSPQAMVIQILRSDYRKSRHHRLNRSEEFPPVVGAHRRYNLSAGAIRTRGIFPQMPLFQDLELTSAQF